MDTNNFKLGEEVYVFQNNRPQKGYIYGMKYMSSIFNPENIMYTIKLDNSQYPVDFLIKDGIFKTIKDAKEYMNNIFKELTKE